MIFLIPYSFCLKLKAFCTRIHRQYETLFLKSSFHLKSLHNVTLSCSTTKPIFYEECFCSTVGGKMTDGEVSWYIREPFYGQLVLDVFKCLDDAYMVLVHAWDYHGVN